jgi:hypothetical protein
MLVYNHIIDSDRIFLLLKFTHHFNLTINIL